MWLLCYKTSPSYILKDLLKVFRDIFLYIELDGGQCVVKRIKHSIYDRTPKQRQGRKHEQICASIRKMMTKFDQM